jgi:sulfotransferase
MKRPLARPERPRSRPRSKFICYLPKIKRSAPPLISLHAVLDLPKAVQERLYFVRFEDLIEQPTACMSHIYAWLGLSPFEINPEKLAMTGLSESDSHYRMKFLH